MNEGLFNSLKLLDNEITERDKNIIKLQLECKEVNAKKILVRCVYDYPQIIQLTPIKVTGGRPEINYGAISNIIWLTCPYLNDKIHKLESVGFIEKIESFIQNDAALKIIMDEAHVHFYFMRSNLLEQVTEHLPPKKRMRIFNKGVGGTKDISTLKCLHMHYSHFRLYNNNLAGYITNKLLDEKVNCNEVICKNAE